MNFRNIGDAFGEVNLNTQKPNADPNLLLSRQSSVYTLTFDEFQSTWGGGIGKDFGSMNMDELLRSIWTAEESHAMAASSSVAAAEGNLQRQGSLTLPRTLSLKTVDEVWKDLFKETTGDKNEALQSMPQRQMTLGEMTLEEFLLRAGAVREDDQKLDGSVYGDISNNTNNSAAETLPLGFHGGGNRCAETKPQSQQQQQQNFSKVVTTMVFSAPLVTSPGKDKVRILDPIVSPRNQMIVTKNSRMEQSFSPYSFGHGRKPNGGTLEKVVERRQRRMIKNRESASRSRARKQAYTLELEAELVKLKELNQELQRKQNEYEDMQKNQVQQTVNEHWGSKRLRLRRTLTGPW